MKIKKSISLFLASAMLVAIVPATAVQAASKTTLAVGDKIQIGTYGTGDNSEPVEYKVMGKRDADGDGDEDLFLASTKIVTVKEINKWGNVLYKGAFANTSLTSDLRGWLNSDATSFAGQFNDFHPSYYGTPGFMSTMKGYEKDQIVDANLTSLTLKETNDSTGDSTAFSAYNATWPAAWTDMSENYSSLRHVTHTDKIFIPSIEELYTFFGGDDISENIDVEYSKAAISELPSGYVADQKQIWVRDANTQDSSSAPIKHRRLQYVSNAAGDKFVQMHVYDVRSVLGVRPCMYLKADTEIERASADGIVYQIKKKLGTGDRIQIGTYGTGENNEPVVYKIMGSRDANDDGVDDLFLASEKIVDFGLINKYGKSAWKGFVENTDIVSSLRAWLNSDAATYTDRSDNQVSSYNGKPGFMSTMSDYEKSQIISAQLNSLVNFDVTRTADKISDVVGSGTAFSAYNSTWPNAWTSMKDAYPTLKHTVSTDKIFIPSTEELYTFFGGDNIKENIVVGLTKEAVSKNSDFANQSRIWTRDSVVGLDNGNVRNKSVGWYNNAIFTNDLTAISALEFGIRPCMYLNADTGFELVEGETDLYKLAEPSTQKSCYIEYAQTTGGTVLRGTVYNDGAETKNYMLIIAKYDQGDHNRMIGADVYRFSVAPYREGYTESAVLDCGSDNLYNAFLWEEDSLRPLTTIFPIDLSE